MYHLHFEGSKQFLKLKVPYWDVIKMFYSNMKITKVGNLRTKLNKNKIKITRSYTIVI